MWNQRLSGTACTVEVKEDQMNQEVLMSQRNQNRHYQ